MKTELNHDIPYHHIQKITYDSRMIWKKSSPSQIVIPSSSEIDKNSQKIGLM